MRQELNEAVDDYRRFRLSQNIGKNTIRNEMAALKVLLRVNGNIWCHTIDERHVTRMFEELLKTRSANSLRPIDSALRSFFAWCRNTRRMPLDRDPMFGRRPPKILKKERHRIHRSKFPLMLDEAEAISVWHRALTATLLYTLLRGGEAADLRIRDVDLESGYVRARIHKSGIEDLVPISAELDTELRKWLTYYTEQVGELKPGYFLLPARLNTPIRGKGGKYEECRMTLRPEHKMGNTSKHIRPVLTAIGIDPEDKGEGGHTLRRSGARALFEALSEAQHPRPMRVVKEMLHHATEATTEIYIQADRDRLERDDWIRGKIIFPTGGENVRYLNTAAQGQG